MYKHLFREFGGEKIEILNASKATLNCGAVSLPVRLVLNRENGKREGQNPLESREFWMRFQQSSGLEQTPDMVKELRLIVE